MAERRVGWSTTVLLVLVSTGMLILLLLGYAWTQPQRSAIAPEPSPTEPQSTVPPAAVDGAHAALHRIGAECGPDADAPPEIASAVDTIVEFATRYPDGRFPIDDETGTSVSLLLVARNALSDCAPEQAGRLDELLPAELRTG